MTKQEEFKATLMANMKAISKESAIETILFLIALYDISFKELSNALSNAVKRAKTAVGK